MTVGAQQQQKKICETAQEISNDINLQIIFANKMHNVTLMCMCNIQYITF